MKKLLSLPAAIIALVFSLIPGWGCGNHQRDNTGANSDNQDSVLHTERWRVDSLMKAHFPADGPGVVLGVQRAKGAYYNLTSLRLDSGRSFFFSTGVTNLENGEPVTDSSVFNIGSLTKQFTARMIMNLVDGKTISLSAPIGKYLPGLPAPIAALKISELLSHCSGIPDHYGFTDTNLVKHATDNDVLNAVKKARHLYFPAGTHFRYSNTAYCLLGMLIEKCTGMSYEAAMKKDSTYGGPTFLPPKLKSLSFLPASAVIGNRVHGYEKNKSGQWISADAPESIFFTTQADGGMLISMKDYMTWCADLELQFLTEVLLRRTDLAPELEAHTLADTAAGLYYGYGWFVLPRETEKGPLLYHSGFNGGFRTVVLLVPGIQYRIAIFSASPAVDLEDLVHQINLILGVDDKGFIKSGPLES